MGCVRCEINDHIAVITIDNAEKVNCVDTVMLEEMSRHVKQCNANRDVRCVIITGTGYKSFTSGGDLKEECYNASVNHSGIDYYNRLGSEMAKDILCSPLPYIAAVNGYALGAALGVICSCDIAIASKNAVFGLPTTSLGGIPGWGCTQIVTRTVGRQCQMRMVLLNEKLDADEAKRVNMISEILEPQELMPRAIELAKQMVNYAPNALANVKKCVNFGLDESLLGSFEYEHRLILETNTAGNFSEGINAFFNKEVPHFSGR